MEKCHSPLLVSSAAIIAYSFNKELALYRVRCVCVCVGGGKYARFSV